MDGPTYGLIAAGKKQRRRCGGRGRDEFKESYEKGQKRGKAIREYRRKKQGRRESGREGNSKIEIQNGGRHGCLPRGIFRAVTGYPLS